MFLILVCGVATASGAGEADLTVAEEKALLEDVFSPQLDMIDADPARVLGDVAIERIDSPTEALVTLEGHTVLLESEIPLRAPEEDGDLSKVDLSLEEDATGGYAPANPLVDLALPESADEPIAIGTDGLTLSLQGAAETTASPLGEEDLFLPEAREDTSLLLSPISGGLELSAMLLSPDSPQQLTFTVNLPEGQKLRDNGEGGAEVVDATDEVKARVSVPRAFDAEGEEVPVELSVEGSSLVLSVPHRERGIAYPLFVDPQIIEENWSNFTDTSKLNYWFWQYGGVGAEDYIGWRSCISTCWGNGLYIRARSNFTYPAGSYGRWGFVPQGTTTYMRRVIFGPIHLASSTCFGNEPHGYVGVWNTGGFWSVLTNAYPSGYVTWLDTGEGQNLGAGARTAYVAMHASSSANIKCGRDYQLGGATLFLDDPEGPSVSAPTGYPSGWVKDGTNFTVNVPVSDPGLGVKSATIAPAGSPPLSSKSLTCTAHYNDQCPANYTFQFNLSADSFDQGEKEVQASAEDAIKRGSNTSSWVMKVDRTPPEITLDGQLAEATDETGTDAQDPEKWDALKLPVYNLKIDATDGSTASAAAKRSGVKGIAVFLDDRKAPEQVWWAPSCPQSSCPLSKTFTLKLNELSADTHHTLRIIAQDFVENAPRERTIEFEYIPATGIKESDVMQYFPLPDGQGNEDEEEHPSRPELAVNVVNGNLVYRQTDAEVQGVGADLGLDLYYNSLLPESQNSEWGDGWTLSQTPDLELEEPEGAGPVTEATLVEESGGVESKVDLPAGVGEEEFDKRLQATITKEAGGDFGLTDESGETDETLVFDESGRVEEARTGSAATVDYDYEGGDLSELSIEDPGTAMVAPGTLEEDEVSPPALAHSANLGTYGSGDGQLKNPADVAVDPQSGNLWILDRSNSRVQKLGPSGQYISKFGSAGSGEGQLNSPAALALDAAGNVLVVEPDRVQKFSPSGQFISKFGSFGSGSGQILFGKGITVGADGSIWVADNSRLQRFSAAGQFIEQVGASGSGQLFAPRGLSADPQGNVFVTDVQDDKVKVYDKEGDFLRSFGSSGSGQGQFIEATGIEADADGNVFVADAEADRVQLFDSAGDYLATFGSPGSGEQQLQLGSLSGVASDGKGRVWVSDWGNNRVASVLGGHYVPSNQPALTEDDPKLEVEVSEGLVDSVEGDEAGTIDYEHSGDLLTAVSKPEGEVEFAYDEAGRMTKVTLPNGTYGEIAYADTYGRVKSVKVSVEGGAPKTTYFEYSDEPRRTTVTPPDAPATTYEIGPNGSILRWANLKKPPLFDDIAGTLYDENNRETKEPISVGAHNLVIQAHSDEGIASIQVIANSNSLVDEKTCEQDPEKAGIECVTQEDEWVTETGNWAPGILYLEVIATDRLGESTSERFWVNIPYTPPPDPEAEEPPRFNDIAKFREEHGLDLDLKGDEIAVNDRIFDLMGAWNNPNTPAGEVARASSERWGVPLRQADTAEMEYRDWYLSHDSEVIMGWGESTGSQSYAGYYVDNRAGGIINVVLLGSSQKKAELLASISGLRAPSRVKVAPESPLYTEAALRTIRPAVADEAVSNPQLVGDIGNVWISPIDNKVMVSAVNPSKAESILQPKFGSQVKVVQGAPPSRVAQFSRYNNDGRVQAGDYLLTDNAACSAGFGAWDAIPANDGGRLVVPLQLTAGHCFPKKVVVRRGYPENKEVPFGKVTRRNWTEEEKAFVVDAETIHTTWPDVARSIYINPAREKLVDGYETPVPGQWVCQSGWRTDQRVCGPVLDEPKESFIELDNGVILRSILIPAHTRISGGDSGGPVWIMGTGKAAGVISSKGELAYGYGECVPHPQEPEENDICPITWFTTIQEIVGGAQTLYNSEKLSKEGLSFPEPLYIDGVTVGK